MLLFLCVAFDQYPLFSQKRVDFILFKEAIELMNKKEHLNLEGLNKIVAIRSSLNLGLTSTLKDNFPGINPVLRPLVLETNLKDPN